MKWSHAVLAGFLTAVVMEPLGTMAQEKTKEAEGVRALLNRVFETNDTETLKKIKILIEQTEGKAATRENPQTAQKQTQETQPEKELSATGAVAQEKKGEEKPYVFPPVTVTAPPLLPTARPLPPEYEKHPGPVTVITREEIERSGATSLSEVLNRVPGFNPQISDTRGFSPSIGSRGTNPFGAGAVKILVDGAPTGMNLSDPDLRYYSPAIGTIERIDVLRGATSVLYGEQTAGGVINIITSPPPEGTEMRFRGSFDSHGGARQTVSYGGRVGDLGYYFQYLGAHGESFQSHDGFHENDIWLRLSYRANPQAKVDLTLNRYDNIFDDPGGLTLSQFKRDFKQAGTPNDRWERERFSGSLNLDWRRSEASKINALTYYNDFDRSFIRPGAITRIHPKVLGGDVSHALTTKLFGRENILVTGLKLEDDRRDGGGDRTVDDFLVAPYFRNTFTIIEPLALTFGVRFEHIDTDFKRRDPPKSSARKTFNEVVWSVGSTYRPIERITFFGNIQRTFQLPTRQAFTQTGNFAGIAFGFEELDPQTAIQYDLGVRTHPTDWLSLDLALFRFDFENLPVLTPLGGGVTLRESIGVSRHQGIEARVDLGLGGMLERLIGTPLPDLRGLGAFTNVAFLDAEIRKFKTFSGNRVPLAPMWTTSFGLTYRHPIGFSGSYEGRFTSEQFMDPENTRTPTANGERGITPSRTIWGLNLEQELPWRLMGVKGPSVFLSVKNLFNKEFIETRLSPSSRITPGLPRTFIGGLSFRF